MIVNFLIFTRLAPCNHRQTRARIRMQTCCDIPSAATPTHIGGLCAPPMWQQHGGKLSIALSQRAQYIYNTYTTRTHTYTHTQTHTRTNARTHMDKQTSTHTQIDAYRHGHTHRQTDTGAHTRGPTTFESMPALLVGEYNIFYASLSHLFVSLWAI